MVLSYSVGTDIINNYNQTDKQNRLADPSVALNQSLHTANMTSNSVPKSKVSYILFLVTFTLVGDLTETVPLFLPCHD